MLVKYLGLGLWVGLASWPGRPRENREREAHVIADQGKIVSEDGRIEYTDLCDVSLDARQTEDGELQWFGWILLPRGASSFLGRRSYLLRLQDGRERLVMLRDQYSDPAPFDGIGAPP